MSDLGEMVNATAFGDDRWSCPFEHTPGVVHAAENVMPPVDGNHVNDAAKLSSSLKSESYHQENLDITVWGKKYVAQYTAHHIIPGNGSWRRNCKIMKWVDDADGHIVKDIGYDVNHWSNGVDLPSIHGLGKAAWSGATEGFQNAYAFAAMEAAKQRRQFHDTHPAYNDFVFNVLEKIGQKLDDKQASGEVPGCGRKNCGGGSKTPKHEPPYGLNARLAAVALRLEGYLTGDPRGWRKPLFTSRMALMYKKHCAGGSLAQADATDELDTSKFTY